MVTLVIVEDGEPLGEAWVDCQGLARKGRSNRPLGEVIEDELSDELAGMGRKVLASDERLIEALKKRARNCCFDEIGKKPEVQVVVSRLSDA